MALTVVVRSGDRKTPLKLSFDAPRVVIGRGDGCEIRLPDPSVSHRHASIRQRGSDYVLIDEGSTNGTFVGHVRLPPQAPRVLRKGELVRIGRIWLEFSMEAALPTRDAQLVTRDIALSLVADALSAGGEPSVPKLKVVAGPDLGSELSLAEFDRPYVVGRGPGLDLVLKDNDGSRRHVEVVRRGRLLLVKDLGSKNGVRLGDQLLEPHRETPWPRALCVSLGQTELAYEDPVAAVLAEIEAQSDERLEETDPVDPPNDVALSPPAPKSAMPRPDGSRAPMVALPVAAPLRKKGGFRAADLLIALLALLVTFASLMGLFWLFRTS